MSCSAAMYWFSTWEEEFVDISKMTNQKNNSKNEAAMCVDKKWSVRDFLSSFLLSSSQFPWIFGGIRRQSSFRFWFTSGLIAAAINAIYSD